MHVLKKHINGQPFVFTTGLAALIHSTWSLGTLFAGAEPAQFTLAWFSWLLPALLIAFSLDVGQIVTSVEIRAGTRTRAKYATFIVFAVATYYLQWLYIAQHMPNLGLAPGVRPSWADTAALFRDAALWFIPALLPMSTTLYTFSHTGKAETVSNSDVHTAERVTLPGRQSAAAKCDIPDRESVTPFAALPGANLAALPPLVPEPLVTAAALPGANPTPQNEISSAATLFAFTCPDCGYTNSYQTEVGRAQGKRAHDRHCAEKVKVQP